MRIALKILMFVAVSAYLVVMLGFADRQYRAVVCGGLEIVVKDSLQRGLVTSEDVRNLVHLDNPRITGLEVADIDMAGIEENLNAFPAISDAQVYTNVNGKLIVEVSQRSPIVRIEDQNHRDFYLDADGYVIPATMEYSPHILFANGHIPGKYRKTRRLPGLEDETTAEKHDDAILSKTDEMMKGLLELSDFIHNDKFWSSQIVQVYVNRQGEFELIPRVGSQIILFGSADRLEYKFFKLETIYREGFSRTGWNQYELINLKYNNQVICTKR